MSYGEISYREMSDGEMADGKYPDTYHSDYIKEIVSLLRPYVGSIN